MPDLNAGSGTFLVGRTLERITLGDLVNSRPSAAGVLVMLGAPGAGKTALLADTAQRARSAGLRVLRVTGRESETWLAFAGLHQLLLPVLAAVERLPDRQRRSLEQALGLAPVSETGSRDGSFLTGTALLAVLADLSRQSPVLVMVDDAHWLDADSLSVLAFAARRMETNPVIMLVAARDTGFPAGFERHARLRLRPLSEPEARRLLDALPEPPRGEARLSVLAQAGGNPLMLVELSRSVAARPKAAWSRAAPLPLAERVTDSITGRLAALPQPTRNALLAVAVAGDADLPALLPGVLAPAVRIELIVVEAGRVQFTHPLVRSAVYHAAPFAERSAAHRLIAASLTAQPGRRAWHLAEATLDTDEDVARLLEITADDARQRGGPAAAVAALERAAELSPEPRERGRRLAAAATLAAPAGQADAVQDLVARAVVDISDAALLAEAWNAAAWALMWTGRHEAALTALLSLRAGEESASLRWTLLASAATVAYASGVPGELAAVRDALAQAASLPEPVVAERSPEVRAMRLWAQVAVAPFRDAPARDAARFDLAQDASWAALSWMAPAVWLLDQTRLSVRLHEELMRRVVSAQVGPRGGPLSSLSWSYVELGRWDEALAAAAEGIDVGLASKMPTVIVNCDLVLSAVYAMRGQADEARRHAAAALDGDPERSRAVEARGRHALALAAMGDGDYPAAYDQLRGLFALDGTPLHFHISYLALADLAAAAVRSGAGPECRRLLPAGLANLDGTPTPRVAQLIARARALLADADRAEHYFAAAVADPVGGTWPFERALLRLDYGEWLRRRRRINEAKPLLRLAADVFRGLRAQPWLKRAETELRACGVDVVSLPGALGELSPQQRQVVYLASQGLTNQEIADRLFLSHRTVSSHLHLAFPKLGVTDRHQLRSVLAGSEPA